MDLEVLPDAETVSRRAATLLADEARRAVTERGRFCVAVSGGSTPWQMLRALAEEDVPWESVHVFQVDERVAPDGDPERNFTHLRESLLARAPIAEKQIHAMPVGDADLEEAARRYARVLEEFAGVPPVLDVVHLGLGPDGHTASLVPGDAVLLEDGVDVALTGRPYRGRRRMTVTYPLLARARRILWLVTGEAKRAMLRRLRGGDPSIPAGRVRSDRTLVLADRAAAQESPDPDPEPGLLRLSASGSSPIMAPTDGGARAQAD